MNRDGHTDLVYEVFARAELDQPLSHVGSLRAPADDLARAYARATFDEDHWVEMIAVPRGHIVSVIALDFAS